MFHGGVNCLCVHPQAFFRRVSAGKNQWLALVNFPCPDCHLRGAFLCAFGFVCRSWSATLKYLNKNPVCYGLLWLAGILCLLAPLAATAEPVGKAPQLSRQNGLDSGCFWGAVNYHSVNPHVLWAILRVESKFNPLAIRKNTNGTLDVGMGQMNSVHFTRLARYGIAPADLLNGCVATYVAAWHIAGLMSAHGNTWEGIARYHSATPHLNRRYQALLASELSRAGIFVVSTDIALNHVR